MLTHFRGIEFNSKTLKNGLFNEKPSKKYRALLMLTEQQGRGKVLHHILTNETKESMATHTYTLTTIFWKLETLLKS